MPDTAATDCRLQVVPFHPAAVAHRLPELSL